MSANKKNRNKGEKINIRWMLVLYDLMIYAVVTAGLLILYNGVDKLDTAGILQQVCLSVVCIFIVRFFGKIYEQVWRYGGIRVIFAC